MTREVVMRLVATVMSLAIAVLLAVDFRSGLFRHTPGGDAFDFREHPFLIIGFVIASFVAFARPLAGGALAALVAGAFAVFAQRHLRAPEAVVSSALVAGSAVAWLVVGLTQKRQQTSRASSTDIGRRWLVGASAAAAALAATGFAVARRVMDRIYGPTHPESASDAIADSFTRWIWSGAVDTTGATITARLVDTAARALTLRLSTDHQLDDGDHVESASDDDGFVRVMVDGLRPGTEYHYALVLDERRDTRQGRFRTAPDGPASFAVACGSCARTGSNGRVWDAISASGAELMIIMGDYHYADISRADDSAFRDVLDHQLGQPAQGGVFRAMPVAYVWDDHDWGGNDASIGAAAAAHRAYRRYVPHHPLAGDTSPVHQAFSIGRVRFVMTDARAGRVPASGDRPGTMLGDEQKAWFRNEMRSAAETHAAIVWVNPVPWIAENGDGDAWDGFAEERREIADFLVDHEIAPKVVVVSGDAHMVAIDDGTNAVGGFPVLQAAALDRVGTRKGGPYSYGEFPGGGQFGLVEFVDDGDRVSVTLSGRTWRNETLVEHRTTI